MLPNGNSATISAAGEVTLSDPAAEQDLAYYLQNKDGSVETISYAEFHDHNKRAVIQSEQ